MSAPHTIPMPDTPDPQHIADAVTAFLKEHGQPDLSLEDLDAATQELVKELTTWMADNNTDVTPEALNTFLEEFGTLLDSFTAQDFTDLLFPKPPLLDTVIDFFTTDDWSYTKLQGESILQLGFQGENGQWHCTAQVNEDAQRFAFYSHLLTNAPPTAALAEFIARANYGLALGNFELDYADGEIRYKTSIDVQGDALSTDLVRNLVYANVLTMDQYLPGLRAVLSGSATPTQAIHRIEQSDPVPPQPTRLDPMTRLMASAAQPSSPAPEQQTQ